MCSTHNIHYTSYYQSSSSRSVLFNLVWQLIFVHANCFVSFLIVQTKGGYMALLIILILILIGIYTVIRPIK